MQITLIYALHSQGKLQQIKFKKLLRQEFVQEEEKDGLVLKKAKNALLFSLMI